MPRLPISPRSIGLKIALSLCASGCLWACADDPEPEPQPPQPAPIPPQYAGKVNPLTLPNPVALDKGRALFGQYCASCHGEQGLGDGPAGTSTQFPPSNLQAAPVRDYADDRMLFIVSDGVPSRGMPGYKELLGSETAAWEVILFMRTLALPASPSRSGG